MTVRIDVWSDVVCPYCYVGKRRLEAAIRKAGIEAEVVYRAFELDPRPRPSVPLPEWLARRFGGEAQARAMMARATEMAAAEGIEFHMEKAIAPRTFDAHRLVLHAHATKGLGPEMTERLMRAHFTEGADLADRRTLLRLAREVGLDGADVEAMLASDARAADVREDQLYAQGLGIRGVPFFLIDRKYAVSGAQSVEVFERALGMAVADGTAPRAS